MKESFMTEASPPPPWIWVLAGVTGMPVSPDPRHR